MIDKNISQQLSLTLNAAEIRKFSERKKLFLSGRLLCEKNLIQSLSFALPGGKISSAIIREDSGLQIFSASLFVENKFEPQKLALYVLFELNSGQSVASILVVNEITTNSIHFENTEFESDNQKLANNLLKNSIQLNHNLSDASDLAVVFSASLAREDLLKSLTVFQKITKPVRSLIIVISYFDQELLDYFAINPHLKVYYDQQDNISVITDEGASRLLFVYQALDDSQNSKIEELIRNYTGNYSDKNFNLSQLSSLVVETQGAPAIKKEFPVNKQGVIYV